MEPQKEDIRDVFVPSFYFGCEADDRVTSSAFDSKRNPFKTKLNVVYSSAIGHFDVCNDRLASAQEVPLPDRL
jgi:hypothetical protein